MIRRLLALAVAAPLIFAGNANAVLPAGNIVQNGDAEAGPGATNETDAPPVPNWLTLAPSFTAVVYGTSTFPTPGDSAAIGGGANFFAGGPPSGGDVSGVVQEIDLSAAEADFGAGNVNATLTAELGGFGAQGDSTNVVAQFATESGEFRGGMALQPVSAEDRGNVTGFRRRVACSKVEPGATKGVIVMTAQRLEGSYNDGYADNVSITLSTAPCPPAPDAPLPPPAPPQPGVSGNAAPSRGRVFVKQPGSNTFQELRDARSIPVGSEIDTEKGEVELTTAASSTGATQIGKFRDGKFTMTQTPGRRPITDLTLAGTRLDKCPRSGTQSRAAASRSRRLWGNARGRFRTRGRYATATVRGTQWMVRDTCTTTTVQVARGTVTVRDLTKRRNIRLKAPKRYTARARRR